MLLEHLREVLLRLGRERMALAEAPALDGERLAVGRLGLGVGGLLKQKDAEVIEAHGHGDRRVAEEAAADGERLAEERLGLGIPVLPLERGGEPVECLGRGIALLAQPAPPCLERGTEVRLRFLVAIQVHQRLAQPLAVLGHLEAVPAIERGVLLQRLPEQIDRLVVESEVRVRAAEDTAELRLDLGLTSETRVHPPRALREQRARGDLPAVPPRRAHRVGHVEDADDPVAHLLGLLCLDLRALPEPALAREPAGEQGQDRDCTRECATVPAGELREPVARRVRARVNRASVAVAPEIRGQLGGGLVAARGILAQCGEHDQVEIAAELTAPPLERLRRRLRRLLLADDARELGQSSSPARRRDSGR